MAMLKLLLTLCVLLCVSSCFGYKILVVFPFPGKSHSILGDAFVRHILNGGHEVTYITAIPLKNPPAKLRQIDVSSNSALMPTDDFLDFKKILKEKSNVFADVSMAYELMGTLANGTVTHTEVQKLLRDKSEQYDAVLVEWMYNELYCGFSVIFDCPLIWSSSMDPHSLVLSLIDEDTNPAYVTESLSTAVPPFTFLERVQELWRVLNKKYHLALRSSLDNGMFQAAFGPAASVRGLSLPTLDEAKYTGSLMFGNSHYSTGSSIRLPQNYVHIGGYHIEKEIKPLPEDLKRIMENSKNGVIYFSMGSVLKSRSMPEELKRDLLKMFGTFRQTVLWKFEEILPNLPDNVHIVQWAPQMGILSHPNCVLFITHGGLLSLTETIHNGVPVIGIPTFADQFSNVNRAVAKGFAKRVDLDTNMAVNLKTAIKDILDNPEYKKRAKELSLVYHDRVMDPGYGFAKHLLRAGHQVTLITATPMEKPQEGLRTIDLSSNYKLVPMELLDLKKIMNHEVEVDDIDLGMRMVLISTISTLKHENVQALLHDQKEKFDVVIAEWMFSEIYAGFGPVFNCPLIWSSSVDPHNLVLSLIDEDVNPAYIPNLASFEIPPFTFKQRVYELWRNLRIKYTIWKTWHTQEEAYQNAFAAAAAKRGVVLPPVEEAIHNASLLFGNSHYSIGSSVRLPQNYIHIAGYHIDDEVKPLPKNLKVIMDNATNGVIFFSLGSVVKPEGMPDEMKTGLLDTFRVLKQTVIWKFDGQLPNVPENVHIVDWAPQPSILAHPNCVLFISHGGLLSITESIHYGVPIIGIPVFGDQFNNVNKVVAKGFGKRVDISIDMPEKLKTAIKELLENPSYRERMKEINFIHHHRRMAPGKEIVHWVEHVVRTRGAPHLRSPALDMPFYQKMYLDLLALILLIIASVLILVIKMYRYFNVKTNLRKKLN